MSLKKESLSDVRLHGAARRGDVSSLRKLLDSGRVHPDSRDKDGTTPLMIAAAAGHFECCKELVRQGANASLRRNTGAGSLFLAAQGGFCDVVRLLIRAGANVNSSCKDGGTALMIAAQEGYADICRELLDNGADLRQQMKDGATSLFLAAQNGHSNVVALILSTAARQEASSSPSGEVMTKPVEMVNLRRVDGTTALWMAVQMGFDNIVRLLIKGGANIEISRNDGVSPLLKACQKDHVDVVRELLLWRPSLGLAQNGDSPLSAAVLGRNFAIIRLLVEAGADPHLPNTGSGLTPRALAANLQMYNVVQLFDEASIVPSPKSIVTLV